jgi:hypothetical protein
VNPAVAVPMLDLFTDQQLVYYADVGAGPAAQTIAELPWRWTWEVGSPEYLSPVGTTSSAVSTVVVIQSEAEQAVPDSLVERMDGYQLKKEFAGTTRVFRYQTIVRIYQRA